MLIIIELVLILMAFIKPQSERIAKAIVIFMLLMYGLNTYSGDFLTYQWAYNNISSIGLNHFEFLFSFLMMICSKIGLTFIQFRMVLAIIYSLLCYKSFSRYTKYTALALALSLIFPFPYYLSVLRSGIAAMFMLYSVRFLDTEVKNGVLKFIALTIVAILFHITSVVFMILILARKADNRKYLLCVYLGTLAVTLGFSNLELLSKTIGIFIDRAKTLIWLSPSYDLNLNWKGILSQIILVFANIFINIFVKKQIYSKSLYIDNLCLHHMDKELKFYRWFSVLSCNASYMIVMFIPIMFVTDVVMRYLWAVLSLTICSSLNVAYISDLIKANIPQSRTKALPIARIMIVTYIIIVAIYANLPYIGTVNSVTRLFFNNLLNVF